MKANLLIATQNRGKLLEFESSLAGSFSCISPTQAVSKGHLSPDDLVENGQTYYENALKKALAYHRAFQLPTLADDSGFEVEALGNGPGVFSARFGGETLSWPERWKLVHEKLASIPPERWVARFRCVLCYYDGMEVPKFFQGISEGFVSAKARGEHGFGYDPIFFSPELGKTFAEAIPSEKAAVSHRGRAVARFIAATGT
jgi:XTP/dITP diphosphohydrolase